jgi:hypothetical protein
MKFYVPFCACLALAVANSAIAQSKGAPQQQKPAEAAAAVEEHAKLVVRVYAVDDLLVTPTDYPLPSALSLGRGEPRLTTGGAGDGMGGMGGGMGGGSGGGTGGGLFSIDPKAPPAILRQFGGGGGGGVPNQQPTAANGAGAGLGGNQPHPSQRRAFWLMKLVKTYVKGDWDPDSDNDSDDRCSIFNKNLIVRHTEEGQRQVAELLKALGSGSSSVRSVTVKATWLALDPGQRETLLTPPADSTSTMSGPSALNAKLFRELAAQSTAFRGSIVCLNGQKVHLTTGARRVISRGATPTVGVGAAAYTAMMGVVNVGAVLQVTPSISSDRHSAFVDVQSAITHWGKPGESLKVSSDSFAGSSDKSASGTLKFDMITVDRPKIGTQEWSTTASIPLDAPVLIGSATLTDPNDDAEKLVAGGRRELALILEIHAN